jgi:hypothetical protein
VKYEIEVPERLVAGLNKVVGRYNADNGTAYDVAEWLQLHAREIAVQDELLAEQQRLVKQAEADVAAALAELRVRLTAVEVEVEVLS